MRNGLLTLCSLLGLALATGTAAADEQKWAFLFDVSLAADPVGTGNAITQGAATLPPLPVDRMTTLQTDSGTMTLWFWPQNAAVLSGIRAAAPDPMEWPTTVTMCAKHAAFAIPTLLTGTPTTTCTEADAAIRAALSAQSLGACLLVEQPEIYAKGYVPDYAPDKACACTSTLEGLIGLAGQALAQTAPPAAGVLPADFVPTLRTILQKIRHDPLAQQLQQAKAAYAQAASLATTNAACFDPTALAQLTGALGELTTEVNTAAARLEELKTTGEAAYSQEIRCLAAQSRTRNALFFPSLTEAERKWIAFWVGGLFWRIRGGGLLPLGQTQEARWCFLYQAFSRIGEVIGGQDAVDVAFQFYIQVMINGWSDWQDMGSMPGGDKYEDLVGMSNRGREQAQVGINILQQRGYDWHDVMTGGLQMGPGYYYALAELSTFRYAMDLPQPPYGGLMDGFTSIGEFTIGSALELGLAQAMLAGWPTGQPPTVNLCEGRVCGDDGCGGSCGSCGSLQTCDADGQCVLNVATDAGVQDDAGVGPQADAGPRDAASVTDAAPGADAAPAAETPTGSSSGCGCRVPAARPPASFVGGALTLLAALAIRRARRRTPF